jgi:hypothetical protein
MSVSSHPSLLVSCGIAALVVWRLYARIRRMVGRQKLSRGRPWFTVTVFPVLLALLLLASRAHPVNAATLVGGTAFGVALGLYGLRLTRFEVTPQGLFYTPSAHLGIALSLLFITRVLFRVAQFYFSEAPVPVSTHSLIGSPLTLAIFGTLAGYYVSYAIGLLRWARRPVLQPADDA